MAEETPSVGPIELAAELTIAWVGNPNTRASGADVSAFLNTVYDAMLLLGNGPEQNLAEDLSPKFTPAVTAKQSLSSPEHIISLINGKPYKTLRRHLSKHGLTPDGYRERYNLKADYPMVSPTYSEVRRSLAKANGLAKAGQAARKTSKSNVAPEKRASRRGRKAPTPKPE